MSGHQRLAYQEAVLLGQTGGRGWSDCPALARLLGRLAAGRQALAEGRWTAEGLDEAEGALADELEGLRREMRARVGVA